MSSERTTSRNNVLILVGIVGIFLVVSLLMLWRYYFILPDSTYLLALGKNIVTGHGLTINGGPHFRYPPAYGTVSGLIYLLAGNLEAAAHIVSLLSGVGAIIIVYFYTSNSYGRPTGLIAAGLVAVNPLFCRISSAALGESFYALGYAAFILVLFKLLKKPNWWLSLIAGVIASIVYLTRAEGFLTLPLGFIVLLIAWLRGKYGFRIIALCLAMLVIGWMLLGFPYLLFLKQNLGGWALSGKITQNVERVSEAIYTGDYESTRDIPLSEYKSPGLIPYFVQNFPRVLERYVFFSGQAIKMVLLKALPLVVLFIWFSILAIRNDPGKAWLYIAMASPLIVYPIAHIETRYITPYFIAFVPVIACGIDLAWKTGQTHHRKFKIRHAFVVLTFAMMLLGCVWEIHTTMQPPYEHRILADWMAENLQDARTARISSRFGYTNFYLNNENFRYLPKADSIDESVDIAREKHVTYLIIDERLTAEVRPVLESLLNPANVPDDLELVVKLDPPDVPATILLYRIKPEQ